MNKLLVSIIFRPSVVKYNLFITHMAKKCSSSRLYMLTPILGTELENLSVAQTVISTGNSMRDVLAFNYASQALNNSFFFDNLVSILAPVPTVVLMATTASTRAVITTTYLILYSLFGDSNLA